MSKKQRLSCVSALSRISWFTCNMVGQSDSRRTEGLIAIKQTFVPGTVSYTHLTLPTKA